MTPSEKEVLKGLVQQFQLDHLQAHAADPFKQCEACNVLRKAEALLSQPAAVVCKCREGSSLPDGQHFVGCPLWKAPMLGPKPATVGKGEEPCTYFERDGLWYSKGPTWSRVHNNRAQAYNHSLDCNEMYRLGAQSALRAQAVTEGMIDGKKLRAELQKRIQESEDCNGSTNDDESGYRAALHALDKDILLGRFSLSPEPPKESK